MITRRQFLSAAAIAAAGSRARVRVRAQATRYDLIIKGGRVIDPSARLDAVRDVAISGGRIAAVNAGIAGDAAETIDADVALVAVGRVPFTEGLGLDEVGVKKDNRGRIVVDGHFASCVSRRPPGIPPPLS